MQYVEIYLDPNVNKFRIKGGFKGLSTVETIDIDIIEDIICLYEKMWIAVLRSHENMTL